MLRSKHQAHGNMLTETYLILEGFYMTTMKNIMLLLQEELMVVRLLEKTINLDFFLLHLLDGLFQKKTFLMKFLF